MGRRMCDSAAAFAYCLRRARISVTHCVLLYTYSYYTVQLLQCTIRIQFRISIVQINSTHTRFQWMPMTQLVCSTLSSKRKGTKKKAKTDID